jgi:hypothetical protein
MGVTSSSGLEDSSVAAGVTAPQAVNSRIPIAVRNKTLLILTPSGLIDALSVINVPIDGGV